MAPQGSRKGNDTLTKTTFKVGDKVQILSAARILYASQYLNDGDIATVKKVSTDGTRPTLNVTTSDGHKGGLYIMTKELPFIKKVAGESEQLNHPYKLGDKVRILRVRGIDCASPHFKDGDITTIVATNFNRNPRVARFEGDTHGLLITKSELRHIEKVETVIEASPTVIEVTTMSTRISQLESQVASLTEKVRALETGNVDMIPSRRYPAVAQASPPANPQRAEVIESAKQYVEDLTARMYGGRLNHEGNTTFRHRTTKPYFTTEGRTVKVSVRGSGLPTEYERASATCTEGDVFNEDIGRAIALGRAMGLDVPTAFTKAPQPTEVVAGMEVDTYYEFGGGKNPHCPTTVTHIQDGMPAFGNGSHSSLYKITDDTNAQYQSAGMGAF